MDAGSRAPKVGALGDAGAIAERLQISNIRHHCRMKTVGIATKGESHESRIDHTSLLGDHSEREPPDPIPNSEVKPFSADDSVAVCHAKVGNCQALKSKPKLHRLGFFLPEISLHDTVIGLLIGKVEFGLDIPC